MTGRVVIVTGANSGLGYEVTRYLCEGGNDVILACRSEERGNAAVDKIKKDNPNALATFMRLDLSSKKAIEEFVEEFHKLDKKLNVLINNAGIGLKFSDTKRQFTTDGFELTMGTNHLGHFLLTNLLLEDLKKAGADGGEARVVTITSAHHDPDAKSARKKPDAVDFENLMLDKEGTYNGLQAYKNSKAANVMFTYELARQLEGSGVTANCVCPGYIPSTGLTRHNSAANRVFTRYIVGGVGRVLKFSRSIKQGAMEICNVASDEKYKGVTGKYYRNGAEAQSSAETRDEENQKKLWTMSGGFLKMEGYDPIDVPPPPAPEEEKKEEEKKEEGEGEKKEEEKEGDTEEKKEGEGKEEDGKEVEIEVKGEEGKGDGTDVETTKAEEKKLSESEDNKTESTAEEKKVEA